MYKIIVCDDERSILERLISLINKLSDDFEVIGSYENGYDALVNGISLEPDILITDIKMPYIDGINLIEQAKIELPLLQSIIISGYDSFDYAKKGIELGVNGYISKPITFEELKEVLLKTKEKLNQETKGLNNLKQQLDTSNKIIIENDLIKYLDIYTIEGKISLAADSFIDSTGSGYIFKQAKIKTRSGLNYLTYATSTYKNGLKKPVFQYSGASMYGNNQPEGVRCFIDIKQKDVNEYLLIGQQLCLKEYEDGKFNDISILPSMSQFRKISSICGEYALSKDDLYKYQEDSIGVIGVFDKVNQWYELPIGILFNNKIKNLFASGRIVSCKDDEAWEATRVIPVCALTGEVSGYLASYYNKYKKIDIKEIQSLLMQKGVKIHYN